MRLGAESEAEFHIPKNSSRRPCRAVLKKETKIKMQHMQGQEPLSLIQQSWIQTDNPVTYHYHAEMKGTQNSAIRISACRTVRGCG